MRDQAKEQKKVLIITIASQRVALLGLGSFVRWKNASVTGSCFRHDVTAMHLQGLGYYSRVHFVLQVRYNEAVLLAPQ